MTSWRHCANKKIGGLGVGRHRRSQVKKKRGKPEWALHMNCIRKQVNIPPCLLHSFFVIVIRTYLALLSDSCTSLTDGQYPLIWYHRNRGRGRGSSWFSFSWSEQSVFNTPAVCVLPGPVCLFSCVSFARVPVVLSVRDWLHRDDLMAGPDG